MIAVVVLHKITSLFKVASHFAEPATFLLLLSVIVMKSVCLCCVQYLLTPVHEVTGLASTVHITRVCHGLGVWLAVLFIV